MSCYYYMQTGPRECRRQNPHTAFYAVQGPFAAYLRYLNPSLIHRVISSAVSGAVGCLVVCAVSGLIAGIISGLISRIISGTVLSLVLLIHIAAVVIVIVGHDPYLLKTV